MVVARLSKRDSCVADSGTEPLGSAVIYGSCPAIKTGFRFGTFGTEPSGSAVIVVVIARLKAGFRRRCTASALQNNEFCTVTVRTAVGR